MIIFFIIFVIVVYLFCGACNFLLRRQNESRLYCYCRIAKKILGFIFCYNLFFKKKDKNLKKKKYEEKHIQFGSIQLSNYEKHISENPSDEAILFGSLYQSENESVTKKINLKKNQSGFNRKLNHYFKKEKNKALEPKNKISRTDGFINVNGGQEFLGVELGESCFIKISKFGEFYFIEDDVLTSLCGSEELVNPELTEYINTKRKLRELTITWQVPLYKTQYRPEFISNLY